MTREQFLKRMGINDKRLEYVFSLSYSSLEASTSGFADRSLQTVCQGVQLSSSGYKMEHRMFAFISNNWAAPHPLTDCETVLKFIRSNKTSTSLKIRTALHTKQYQKGIRICDDKMKEVNLTYYTQRPNWNYSIAPVKNVN